MQRWKDNLSKLKNTTMNTDVCGKCHQVQHEDEAKLGLLKCKVRGPIPRTPRRRNPPVLFS